MASPEWIAKSYSMSLLSLKVDISSRESTFPSADPFLLGTGAVTQLQPQWLPESAMSCSAHEISSKKPMGELPELGLPAALLPSTVRSPEWDPVNESILEGEAKRWAVFHSKDQEECRSEFSLNLFEPCSIPWEELNCSPSSDNAQGED